MFQQLSDNNGYQFYNRKHRKNEAHHPEVVDLVTATI